MTHSLFLKLSKKHCLKASCERVFGTLEKPVMGKWWFYLQSFINQSSNLLLILFIRVHNILFSHYSIRTQTMYFFSKWHRAELHIFTWIVFDIKDEDDNGKVTAQFFARVSPSFPEIPNYLFFLSLLFCYCWILSKLDFVYVLDSYNFFEEGSTSSINVLLKTLQWSSLTHCP